jgi:hypothetical protein
VGAATVGKLVSLAREGARARLAERMDTAQWQYRWELVGVELLERRQRALLRQTTLAEGDCHGKGKGKGEARRL